uniref:Outer dynein arm-docking complex subunit 4 n=1 Tax=Cacopsylla melanoneura TaxID=428564 RepID=A0A8D8QAN5_9HEMI
MTDLTVPSQDASKAGDTADRPTSGPNDGHSSARAKDEASNILQINRHTELLHSFMRVGTGDEEEEGRGRRKDSGQKKKRTQFRGDLSRASRREARPPTSRSPSPAGPTSFAQLTKELKLRKQQQERLANGGRRGSRVKKSKKDRFLEEVYTDKDRAAAVNMGTRDIKHSLKLKRRQDRTLALQMPEEADPSTLLALGCHELRNGDVNVAINFVKKALELNPTDKNALVARSKCYLLLGESQKALEDAETALENDKSFIRAIFQKAEALYHLGDFEHSLMYYHRGLKIRPELEEFRLGVQKAQEAIENTIGKIGAPLDSAPNSATSNASADKTPDTPSPSPDTAKSSNNGSETKQKNKTAMEKRQDSKKISRLLLGELHRDKEYLENLVKNPNIRSPNNPESSDFIIAQAEEGIKFLINRQEFWRQQRSVTDIPKPMARKKKLELAKPKVKA